MKRYALSAIGRDRPGIVASVARVLYEHGFNIEDSTMTRLEDEFAIILVMSIEPEADTTDLSHNIREVEQEMGLTINLKELPPEKEAPEPAEPNYIITLHGADRAGIVFKTAELLSGLGINITDLETKAIKGDAEHDRLYIMLLEVYSPEDVFFEALEGQLTSLGEELGVVIKIKPIGGLEPL